MRFQHSTSITICINVCRTYFQDLWTLQQLLEIFHNNISNCLLLCCVRVYYTCTQCTGWVCDACYYFEFDSKRKNTIWWSKRENSKFMANLGSSTGPIALNIFKGLLFMLVKEWILVSFIVKFYCYHIVIIRIHNNLWIGSNADVSTRGCFKNNIFMSCTIWLISWNKFIAPIALRRFFDGGKKIRFQRSECWQYETNYFVAKIQLLKSLIISLRRRFCYFNISSVWLFVIM